jgi:hypothetical protein
LLDLADTGTNDSVAADSDTFSRKVIERSWDDEILPMKVK